MYGYLNWLDLLLGWLWLRLWLDIIGLDMLLLLLLLLGALSNWTVSPPLFENLWPCPAQWAAMMTAFVPVGDQRAVWWIGLHALVSDSG